MSWPLGLSTGIGYRHPIAEVLGPIARAGIEWIEVSTAPHHIELEPRRVGSVARQIGDLGLKACSLHAPFGHDISITSPDSWQRRHALERLARAADAAHTLGSTLYVIHPGGEDVRWVWEREQRLALSVEGLTRVWEMCRERGLTLVVETPLPHLLGGHPADLAWILDRLPASAVLCVDTSHCSLGRHLIPMLEQPPRPIAHLQVSDNRGVTDDHLPPGEGVIGWPDALKTLRDRAYAGVFMLEVSGDGPVAEAVERAVQAARRVLAPPEMTGR